MQASVTMCNTISKGLQVINGMKQVCVWVTTLFSIYMYLAAMMEVAFKDSLEGVYIQPRREANLFNVSELKTRTTIFLIVNKELLFADDSALVSRSATDMQVLDYKLAEAVSQLSLEVNIEKTECLYQPPTYSVLDC